MLDAATESRKMLRRSKHHLGREGRSGKHVPLRGGTQSCLARGRAADRARCPVNATDLSRCPQAAISVPAISFPRFVDARPARVGKNTGDRTSLACGVAEAVGTR